jgi:Domain of unknown function DUF29
MNMAKALERSQTLHDEDLLAWAERQAALLRAGQLDRLDLEHLIDELEAMAGKLRRELKNVFPYSPGAPVEVAGSAQATLSPLGSNHRRAA